MSDVTEFTDENFDQEVLQSSQPVLVDFWAVWCGPCRQIAPMVAELAAEYAGTVKVGKVDIESSPGVAQKYGIMSIPTLVVFKDGEPVERLAGVQSKSRLKETLDGLVA